MNILRFILLLVPTVILAAPGSSVQMEHIVVHRDDTQYYITPWLLQLKSGELIVTAREAHRRPRNLIGHADPTGRGILLRSRDGGRTWGEKIVVDDETHRFSQTEDVPATQLSDGTLLLNLYSWAVSPLPIRFPLNDQQRQAFTITFEGLSLKRSTDGGRTWSDRQPLMVQGLPPFSARVPALELPDGVLLLPVCARTSAGLHRCWLIRSKDKGNTWGEPAVLAADPESRISFVEPVLLRRRDGELIVLLRTGANLYQTNSSDGGRTWSKPFPTTLVGLPAHLLELKDGRILCTFGRRQKPFGLRASISRDGGKTWDEEFILRDDGGTWDLGYPSSVEFPDGRVLTVYWFNQEKPDDSASEVRYIAGTFFRP